MTPVELLATLTQAGVSLCPDGDTLRYQAPVGVLSDELKAALKAHQPELLKLLTAPEADHLSETPCSLCGSRERWRWIDGRPLCRVCLVLDLAPLTLVRQGWPKEEPHRG